MSSATTKTELTSAHTSDWLTTLEYDKATASEVASSVSDIVRDRGVVRVSCFPGDAAELIGFVNHVGDPLEYYGGDTGSHPDQPAVWRVRYEHEASLRGDTHALDGPLSVHSSQSLLEPRPRYFCMLMVNPGWQDNAPGLNGESLLAPWARAFESLDHEHVAYRDIRDTLLAPMRYPDGTIRALAYDLPDARSQYDYGIRLKSDLESYLRESRPASVDFDAVRTFAQAAQRTALSVQLAAGDLIVVDNNRWGHGRQSVIGRRGDGAGLMHTNPRELWSLTLK
ncbi:TauD/TfdA family dioxygenase [Nocardioides terrigena]|uniref:TauD/TfdA family dioxygenase n=1 Tax=Nocardioides terrigena TaxID=424797 RepID=UPI00131EFDB0|nr:TauD/TfdA family dioxygenase [Nocardioides terrigena]